MALKRFGEGQAAPIVVIKEQDFASVTHTVGKWKHVMIRPRFYKMRGYNAATVDYEYWITNNPDAGPPSGAILTNKSISAILIDTFPTEE